MKAIVLAFTLKGQDQNKIFEAIKKVAQDFPNHILIHGNLPMSEVISRNLPHELNNLIEKCFPIRLNMHDGKRVMRAEMAIVAEKLDAEVVVIGSIIEGVREEIDLYVSVGLIGSAAQIKFYTI
jgi:hypothetical protein